MINPRSDRPVHLQVADELRAGIEDGTYPPGARLPSETRLTQEYGIARMTAREAIKVLKAEGLVRTDVGRGTFVRETGWRQVVNIQRGSTWIVRMPTPAECVEHDIDEGVPVLELHLGAKVRLFPGDRFSFRTR